ncbi:MAG TPA: GDSL-type esterase/lipase family protein [Rugosimonospora sp.]
MARKARTPLLVGALAASLAIAAVTAGPSGGSAAQAATAAGPWTGTWAASPQSGGPAFNQQTVRQIVHTSIGGSAARIQLSNVFGTQSVTIADVHVAQRTSGSSIATGTDRQVTFGGATSTTIPAGGTTVSDSVSFTVVASSDVAVSFYLPQPTGSATYHQTGQQTNYIASGDVSANASLGGAQTTGSYYFLANLDVQNAAAAGAVVALGASITDGFGSSSDANHRWPNDLASRLASSGRTVGVLNQGISGNRLLVDGAGQSALNRFGRDVLAQPNVRWVIFSDDPINDLGSTSPPPTAAQLISGIQQLISRAHQAGLKFLCSTLTPYQGAGYWTSQGETAREAVNSFVRGANSGCDGVVDQDAATHDPANPTRYLPAYDSGDHLHPNDAGMQAIANAVDLNLFGSATSSPAVSLRAHANNMYVCAENAGASALIANRTAIGSWETFDLLDAGNGNVALRSHADNMIVTAQNAGASSLIASSTAIGLWETFQLIHNPDGSVSLKALVNNEYVTAESAGAQPLIANRTAIGPWEEFDLIQD